MHGDSMAGVETVTPSARWVGNPPGRFLRSGDGFMGWFYARMFTSNSGYERNFVPAGLPA